MQQILPAGSDISVLFPWQRFAGLMEKSKAKPEREQARAPAGQAGADGAGC